MTDDIIFSLWFLLPAACANVAPILVVSLPGVKHWTTPIDGGRKYKGQDILGPHKTWRGIVSGIIAATLTLWLQQVVMAQTDWFQSVAHYVDYQSLPLLLLGPLFAIGALGGDALKSFFKRRRGIRSGKSWLFFDQLDYVLGAIVITLPFAVVPLVVYGWMLLLWFLIHLLASYVGWLLKMKEAPI